MSADIKIQGKYKEVDLSKLDPEYLQNLFTLVKELELKQTIIDKQVIRLNKQQQIINAFKDWRTIIYKMCLLCNFLQHSWNAKMAENSKAILQSVADLKIALGERPLKLPDLTPKPKENA